MKRLFVTVLSIIFVQSLWAQKQHDFVEFINRPHQWVDSVFNNMTPAERVGQLFMVRAHSNLGQKYIDSVARVIEAEQLGGVVLFQGGPVSHAHVINQYQKLSKVPLLIALDGEWGLGMRLPDSTISYPYQMTLGAVQDENLIRRMGVEVAKDFKRLGMHVNFAPVIDVNNNPKNPVINFRSFGEDKYNVTRKGGAYMHGMTEGGIIVSLKHFPGHGDTDVDSHYDLPVLNFSAERLDSLEMYPFRELIRAGASGIMVAHMHIPSLDDTPNMPSSISKPIVTDILKERLGFKGLIFTDAMDMQGVVKFFKDGEADLQAIIAGSDLLELSENSERAIRLVLEAIQSGRIDQASIDQRVKKVLASKYWLGLTETQKTLVNTHGLYEDLNRNSSKILNQQLADAAITVLRGTDAIKALNPHARTAIVSIGEANHITDFQCGLGQTFTDHLYYAIPTDASSEEIQAVLQELKNFDQLLVGIHDSRGRPRSTLNYTDDVKGFITNLVAQNAIFAAFTNPYTLAEIVGLENAHGLLVAYQNEPTLQRAVVKALIGKIKPNGKLPVTINEHFRGGEGL